jgi:hypothetical protein
MGFAKGLAKANLEKTDSEATLSYVVEVQIGPKLPSWALEWPRARREDSLRGSSALWPRAWAHRASRGKEGET